MHSTIGHNPFPQWRLLALGAAIVLIVVAPFMLLRKATLDSREAWQRVTHTHNVAAAMHALASDVRNLEAGALAIANGVDNESVRARIAESRERIAPTVLEVQRLTRDDADQQVRIGGLQSNIALRVHQAERIVDAGAGATPEAIERLVTDYPIQRLIEEIITEEQARLEMRQARAERIGQRATMASWAAMIAQLLLLGGVVWFSARQLWRRVEAERTASRASARATVVLDTVREPIVLVDGAMRVVMHNAAFAELYGVQEDIQDRPLAAIGGGAWEDGEILRRLSDVLTRGRELWDHEQQQRTVDGIERTMLINARRMPLPDSADAVVLITVSDVSPQKASEQRIHELNRQLQGKVEQVSDVNRELEAFSYSVSHDLRAPLRHIAGFGGKLERHLGDAVDAKGRHYLEVMVGSAGRMSALIDDLLVYSRLGRSALRLQLVDMQSLVAETRAMLDANNAADKPGHRIEWRIGPLPVVTGDENMLRQVWLNLLGNAVKYSRDREPAVIEIGCVRDDGNHRFHVRDNGAGFDMKYADKLFGVFQRLHAVDEFPGTGIGLASVRRVLVRHGGRIWAEAAPGEGATFHFILSAAGDAPAPAGTST
ncbi:sensor histidine kinase [Luteimonas suaedae]|uniref:sensor histidine kinase n=1 Tax=Luteimonas suaedae TaxID=2605430 RepID=UPI0011EE1AD9|nr:ATP-binding protein [Luteimonas suaedae]